MKKIVILFSAVVMILTACSGGGHQDNGVHSGAAAEAVITHKEMTGDVARTVANLTIEGMTCSAGCGGKIQQDLRAMNGVTSTALDFAEDRPANIVTVEFDPSKLNEQQLISCVHNIADGQYHVKSLEVVNYKSDGTTEGAAGGGSEMNSDQLGRAFQVLNLLQTISGMIRE
jgi:copper chaperone CopZ